MANVKYLNEAGTQLLINEFKDRLAKKQDVMQLSVMPLVELINYAGKLVQYIGATDGDFTQGDFYTYDIAESEWVKVTYNKDEIDALVAAAGHFAAVDELPTTDIKTNVIYLVPKVRTVTAYSGGEPTFYVPATIDGNAAFKEYEHTPNGYDFKSSVTAAEQVTEIQEKIDDHTYEPQDITISAAQDSNIKDEYINLDGTSDGWEKIGDTSMDLSGYVKFDDLTAITSAELAAMWGD